MTITTCVTHCELRGHVFIANASATSVTRSLSELVSSLRMQSAKRGHFHMCFDDYTGSLPTLSLTSSHLGRIMYESYFPNNHTHTCTTWPSSAIKASTILAAHPPRAKNFTLGTSSGIGPGLDHAYVQAARPVQTWNQP